MPNCQRDVKIPNRAYFNADNYGQSCKTIVECCGGIINMRPIRTYKLSTAEDMVDDWGAERTDR